MRRDIVVVVGALTVTLLASGCSTFRDREWGSCAVGGAVIGAAVGGITSGVALNNTGSPSDGERAGAIIGGTLVGGGLGAVLGHAVCDPIPEPPAPKVAQVPPPPPPPSKTKIATLKGPNFAFDKATLTPEGEHLLDQAVKTMQDNPSITVTCEGYTDSVGSDAYNLKLSQRRADAAKAYLVKKGIAASRIKTKGHGKADPVASNATAEGRAENRRVEIVVD
jgi:outer membrane protein OmpA-like peptidoglycan-associated protein